ncbi:glycosyltransferase family 2 protein, partial [Campylobacter jejuni]|nr:glycosyltransferase family 2 protein [Campylobacter jejuni]EAI4487840.1 glycosyltransferase family 2 protein [Campylobacter jejuni]EAJ1321281.1 glycosyltransferase family 2 protein [Campylobacter jejuni]EAJ2968692.1 glycosyltransferase family 2 protein [Campylobacter jejuni]EAK5072890.1 glycosyltransferase family 2 protein [Campylobacter jejuni]
MQTKIVGVVIPIYNVEEYLRECLDSVVNQTYKNLQVVLVNDGSTDENSLNIAKEYTLKDERFILFDKENGGQSTARNVGIEFFSKEYHFKNITQELKENSLVEFKLSNEDNPYNIYKIYKSSNFFKNKDELLNFRAPDIDYIIFLDSDDYWELNCIEECVPRMDGVEVVWFDFEIFLDGIDGKNVWNYSDHKTDLEYLRYTENQYTNFNDIIARITKEYIFGFSSATYCMIDFALIELNTLRFINGIYAEDHHFSIILFSLSKMIYIIKSKKYKYRLRQNSSSNHDGNFNKTSFPLYLDYILKDFNHNYFMAKKYYIYASWIITCNTLLDFLKSKNRCFMDTIIYTFINKYFNAGLILLKFNSDPMRIKDKFLLNKQSFAFKYPLINASNIIKFSLEYRIGELLCKK